MTLFEIKIPDNPARNAFIVAMSKAQALKKYLSINEDFWNSKIEIKQVCDWSEIHSVPSK